MTTTDLTVRVHMGECEFALVINDDIEHMEVADYGTASRYTDPATGIQYVAFCDDANGEPEAFRLEPLTIAGTVEVEFEGDGEEDDYDGDEEDDEEGEEEGVEEGEEDDEDEGPGDDDDGGGEADRATVPAA